MTSSGAFGPMPPGSQAAKQPVRQLAPATKPPSPPAKPAANQPAKPKASQTANLPTFFPSVMLQCNSTCSPSVVIAEIDDSYTQISLFHLPIGHTFPVIRGAHSGTLFLGCLSLATCLVARLGDWLAAGLDFQHEGDFCGLCKNCKSLIKYMYKATSPEIHAKHEPI